MPSSKQERDFSSFIKDEVVTAIVETPSNTLDQAIEWVKDNMKPDEVFDQDDLIEWAEQNGYVKES